MCSNVCTAGRVCILKCAFLHLGTDNAIGESPGGQWLLPSGATSMRSCAAFHHSSCGIGAKITPKSLSSRRPGELASDIGDDLGWHLQQLGWPGCRPRCPRLLSIRCACSALEPLPDTHMQGTSVGPMDRALWSQASQPATGPGILPADPELDSAPSPIMRLPPRSAPNAPTMPLQPRSPYFISPRKRRQQLPVWSLTVRALVIDAPHAHHGHQHRRSNAFVTRAACWADW